MYKICSELGPEYQLIVPKLDLADKAKTPGPQIVSGILLITFGNGNTSIEILGLYLAGHAPLFIFALYSVITEESSSDTLFILLIN